jgi:hypothetical protein
VIRKHDAALRDAHITFTWTVSTGDLDRLDAVERLLQSDWAQAVSFQPGDVRLAPAHRAWDQVMSDARGMHKLGLLLDDETTSVRPLLAWARAHRRLSRLIAWHWCVSKLRKLRPQSPGSSSEASSLRDTATSMAAVADEMATRAADLQLPLAVTRYIENEMLRPAYLARVNPTRIRLRPVRATLVVNGKRSQHFLDPLVTLYGSGVFTISIDLPLPAGVTATGLQECARASGIGLVDLWVPAPLRDALSEEGTWTGAEEDGYHQCRLIAAEDGGPGPSFEIVWEVVLRGLEVIPQIEFHEEWHSYPIVAGVLTQCCRNRDAWERRHVSEFESLLLKRPSGHSKMGVHERPVDSSFDPDTWLWHTAAATVQVRWGGAEENVQFEDVARLLTVCEIFLVQLATLRLLSDELVKAVRAPTIRDLRRFAIRLNLSLEEFDHPALTYLSAQNDVERMLDDAGTSGTLTRLQERTSALSTLLATGRAERSARRGLRIAAAALVAAVVLSLPALTDGIAELRRVPPDSTLVGPLVAPLRASTIADVTAALWAIAATLVLIALLLGAGKFSKMFRWIKNRFLRPRKLPGHRWSDGTVRVVPSDRS